MNLQRNPGLLRALGPAMATAVVVGTVIGSGVFKKPQEVSANLPFVGLAALAWILGGILALLGALAYAEIAVLYPQAGGNYIFLREAFGRLMGFLWGWVEFWIIRGASLAALATIFTESLHAVLRETFGVETVDRWLGFWPLRVLTVAVILGLAGVNMVGVRWGGLLQLLITTVKVGSLVFIALLPFALVGLYFTGQTSLPQPHPEYLTPMWPSWSQLDLSKFGVAMLGVLWAYHGWQNIGPVAGEVKEPQRNIPRSLLTGVLIVIALYLGANLAYYLVIPQDEMVKMKEPEAKPVAQPVERIDLAHNAGLVNGDTLVAAEALARRLADIVKSAGLPQTLGECGVSPGILPVLADEAAQQWTGKFNPRPVSERDLLQLYEAAF